MQFRQGEVLDAIYKNDRGKQMRAKRFSNGTVTEISGGYATVDVGATLPDGTPVKMNLPIAAGYNPDIGDMVGISYANDSPHSGMVASVGSSASAPPPDGSHSLTSHTDASTKLLDRSIITEKGQLIVGTADDTVKAFDPGSDDELLVYDSSTDTGVKASKVTAGMMSSEAQPAGLTLQSDGADGVVWGSAGAGDVIGPALAVDGDLAAFDTTTGKKIKDSGITALSVSSHLSSTSNPHQVTKLQVGLGNVTNDAQLKASQLVTSMSSPGSATNVPSESAVAAYVAAHGGGSAPYYQVLLETTLEAALQGTLSTGNTTPVNNTYNFNNSATSNNGIRTTTGSWTQSFLYESVSAAGTWTLTFRTSGGNVVFSTVASHIPSGSFTVTLDGVAQTTWTQATNMIATYTLNVSAGVHTVVFTWNSGSAWIGSVTIPQLPYQGLAVNGDVVRILYAPPWFLSTSIGIGPNNDGGTYGPASYGEGIIHRLPLGTTIPDSQFTRASLQLSGVTFGGVNGLIRLPMIAGATTGNPPAICSINVQFGNSAGAGSRGLQFAAINSVGSYGYSWIGASTVYHIGYIACLAEVTTRGAGSVFSDGELVLFVCGYPYNSNNNVALLGNSQSVGRTGDLFRLESI